MPRPLDTARRAELLEQAMHYVVTHGVAELSLRPLAAALGTSSRMLVHYFGSKENLIGHVLAASRPDVGAILDRMQSPREIATRLWNSMVTDGEHEPRVRLLLEIMGLALTQPDRYGRFAAQAVHAWVEPLARAFERIGHDHIDAAARATLLVSGLRGLAGDRYLTSDRERTDAAAALLIATTAEPPIKRA
jgi:AcrR family transcriptional regulator